MRGSQLNQKARGQIEEGDCYSKLAYQRYWASLANKGGCKHGHLNWNLNFPYTLTLLIAVMVVIQCERNVIFLDSDELLLDSLPTGLGQQMERLINHHRVSPKWEAIEAAPGHLLGDGDQAIVVSHWNLGR